jgi:predicted transcriptional regulator
LDILERPIHCTDTKRKTIYVKESDFWEKDKELNKILNGIKEIASKHRMLIDKWQDANEGWDTNENIQTRLTTLIYNVMTDVENSEKETKKIINAIGKNVYLDEDIKGEYKNVVNNEVDII